MSQKFEKLKTLLKELFQLDQPDLDFGLYRIMHAKSAEVTQFLDRDLLPQVKAEFGKYKTADKSEIEKELAKAIEQAQALGADPETLPKVKELKEKLKSGAVDIAALESEVYDHLFGFFRRYYSEGDFLSKRVYKPGVYAIPYEGEEVKLHWANADQYYIKTSEYLRDYAFRLRPDDDANPMRVHFRLVDAAEGEHGNVKTVEGKDRVFLLAATDFIAEEAGGQGPELAIRFEYRQATLSDWPDDVRGGRTKPPAQKELTALAESRILNSSDAAFGPWVAELRKAHVKVDGEQADYSRLRAHLNRYVARNTFDYFIHKDLGAFLKRELDFYIKNEVMHLDDVEHETAPRVEQYLSKIKVIRRIAGKLVAFLAQLEDFQKKLWLKKKFVVETQYCITLDRIPEDFYPEIAANDAQRMEWIRLFAIDEITQTSSSQDRTLFPDDNVAYSVPLSVDFVRANPALPVDTRFFSSTFTESLIDSLSVSDSTINGWLVHSENFQALRLLHERWNHSIKCVYIDPPYNTASSAIPYKNDYRHSAFVTMIFDRIEGLWRLLGEDGAIFVSIDKTERTVVEHALDEVFGVDNRIEELIWAMNTNNSQAPNYSTTHEYVLVYAKNRKTAEQDRSMFREPKPGFEEVMELIGRLNAEYAPTSTIEESLKQLYEQHKIAYREDVENQGLSWEDEERNDPWKGIYPYSNAEYRTQSGQSLPEESAATEKGRIWVWASDNISMPAAKQSPTTRDPEHRNYRFYKPPHPATRKPCPCPSRGWNLAYAPENDGERSFQTLERDSRIIWGEDESNVPRLKRFLHEVETNVGKSVIVDYSDGEKQTAAMFGQSGLFLAPKHADFVSRFILHAAKSDSTILDCFGGSGSTAHAVIKLNRSDRGKRKFIVVEMADYFDRLLKPRVLKAIYSPDWRAGKPVSRLGISYCIKLLRLESYEDTLNNIELPRRTQAQQSLLESAEAQGADRLKEQYVLRYMLNVETADSPSLLNIQAFTDPTAYRLKVKRPGSDESREINVDLLETFNWLIGLTVQHVAAPQCFTAKFERDSEQRLRLKGRLKQNDAGPWWFRTVTGTTPDGRKTLVIWRKRPGGEVPEGVEQDNLVLDEWFTRQGYSSKDSEFAVIYINGTNNLENLRAPDDTWKVRLIEEDFHRLMFAAEGM
jgi:adenine-specific DNA-methyltransferase